MPISFLGGSKELIFLFFIVFMFRIFKYIGFLFVGASLAGVISLLLDNPLMVLIAFFVGVALGFYLANDQPVIYITFVFLGVAMIWLHLDGIVSTLPNPSFPSFPFPSIANRISLFEGIA